MSPPPRARRTPGWLWLSLMSFTALMLLIAYETRWVHPDIHAYFSQSGNLTGQQLATRSREYLEESLGILLEESDPDAVQRASFQIELGYGLFDIGLYRNEYACTEPNLQRLDALNDSLGQGVVPPPDSLSQGLLQPIRCLTEIEMDQLDYRSAVTNRFVEETRHHQTLVLVGSLVIYLLGLVFWGMHVFKHRLADRATRESLRWMAQALQDPLTGIGNRSALHDDVLAEKGGTMALLLIDIDYFKQYNDALGHPDGDQLLRELVALIDRALSGKARLYRMGGDEFAALLPCDDPRTLASAAASVVEEVRRAALPHPDHPAGTHVTLSVGGVQFTAEPEAFAAAYVAADRALYRVKAQGRDGWQLGATAVEESRYGFTGK
ncbi:sensor domain-containing diguanylate cyclase [Halomonas lysinitropha]|uniref:diguanylate cyclase n=1 Tax=Halomonas lysinitropha TaxID=2607506 RepID=A0A5K1HZC7_9GAMM|nr:GGDEF domain-containing protein [Halomonas lysinitropha]VVZ94944.1 putative diguanylate cyclase YcdT [Halomonas lysinitropha]